MWWKWLSGARYALRARSYAGSSPVSAGASSSTCCRADFFQHAGRIRGRERVEQAQDTTDNPGVLVDRPRRPVRFDGGGRAIDALAESQPAQSQSFRVQSEIVLYGVAQ